MPLTVLGYCIVGAAGEIDCTVPGLKEAVYKIGFSVCEIILTFHFNFSVLETEVIER